MKIDIVWRQISNCHLAVFQSQEDHVHVIALILLINSKSASYLLESIPNLTKIFDKKLKPSLMTSLGVHSKEFRNRNGLNFLD